MNKSDIATKLKFSIEEKLFSLGAYVDKELPEYILVMIANKKNKESMEKDLQLFLGQDTTIFIDWLHDLLGKCQENVENAFRSSKEKNAEINKNISRHSPEKKKKKERSRGKKERKSDEKKGISKSTIMKNRKSRSRSQPPKKNRESPKINRDSPKKNVDYIKKTKHHSPTEPKSTKGTPDKCNKKINLPPKVDSSTITDDAVTKPPALMISSVVKVTDVSQPPKAFIQKECNQRHLRQSTSDSEQKSEFVLSEHKSELRSSVFSRLGKNNLRLTKMFQKSVPESNDKCYKIIDRDLSVEKCVIDSDARALKLSSKRTLKNEEFQDDIFDEIIDLDKPEQSDEDSQSLFRRSKVQKLNEEKLSNTSFIVTLKGAERLNLSVQSRLGPKKAMDDTLTITEDTIMEMNEEVTDTIQDTDGTNKEVIVSSQLNKCKFWPNCKNKELCPFFHPHEMCINFPNCKFGQSCLYIHPNCRFEPNCTKQDCTFTHYQLKILAAVKPHGALGSFGFQRCMYYPNCTNVNCQFFHPNIPCKFGLACKAKETCMFYHPSIPHVNELKWVASVDIKTQVTAANVHYSLAEVPSI